MAAESTHKAPAKKKFTIPEHLKRQAVEVDYSTGWEAAPVIGAAVGLGASALTGGALPPHLAAKLGLMGGNAVLGSQQAEQEAKIAAANAKKQEELSEYLTEYSMETEAAARQAAIDYSYAELVNTNIKRNSPEHSYRAANWTIA